MVPLTPLPLFLPALLTLIELLTVPLFGLELLLCGYELDFRSFFLNLIDVCSFCLNTATWTTSDIVSWTFFELTASRFSTISVHSSSDDFLSFARNLIRINYLSKRVYFIYLNLSRALLIAFLLGIILISSFLWISIFSLSFSIYCPSRFSRFALEDKSARIISLSLLSLVISTKNWHHIFVVFQMLNLP